MSTVSRGEVRREEALENPLCARIFRLAEIIQEFLTANGCVLSPCSILGLLLHAVGVSCIAGRLWLCGVMTGLAGHDGGGGRREGGRHLHRRYPRPPRLARLGHLLQGEAEKEQTHLHSIATRVHITGVFALRVRGGCGW